MTQPMHRALDVLVIDTDVESARDLASRIPPPARIRIASTWTGTEPVPDAIILGAGLASSDAVRLAEACSGAAPVICVTTASQAESAARLYVAGVHQVLDAPGTAAELAAALNPLANALPADPAAGDALPSGRLIVVRGVGTTAGSALVVDAIRTAADLYYGSSVQVTMRPNGVLATTLQTQDASEPPPAPADDTDEVRRLIGDGLAAAAIVIFDGGTSDTPTVHEAEAQADLEFVVVRCTLGAARWARAVLDAQPAEVAARTIVVLDHSDATSDDTAEILTTIGRTVELEIPRQDADGAPMSDGTAAPSAGAARRDALGLIGSVGLQGEIKHALRAIASARAAASESQSQAAADPEPAAPAKRRGPMQVLRRVRSVAAVVVVLVTVALVAGVSQLAGPRALLPAPEPTTVPTSQPTDAATAEPTAAPTQSSAPSAVPSPTVAPAPTASPSLVASPSAPAPTPTPRPTAPPTPAPVPVVGAVLPRPNMAVRIVFRPQAPVCADAPPAAVRAGVFSQDAPGLLALTVEGHKDIGNLDATGVFDLAGVNPFEHWHGTLSIPTGRAEFEVVTGIGCKQTYDVEYGFGGP